MTFETFFMYSLGSALLLFVLRQILYTVVYGIILAISPKKD